MTNNRFLLHFSALLALVFFYGWNTEYASAQQFGGMGGGGTRMDGDEFQDFEAETIEYEYPYALKIPKGRRPQVQAEERVNALKRFSWELYRQIIDDDAKKNQNIVCSPWSIAMVLTMLFDGAETDTAKEIRKALYFQGNSKFFEKYLFMAAFNARGKKQYTSVEAPLILETANSFWSQEGYEFHGSYMDLLESRFLSGLFTVDFKGNPAGAAKEINDWCAEQTRQEIKEIVTADDMDPLRRMFILNAVYFKARWEKVSHAASTKLEWFHHADGSVSKTWMMNMKETGSSYYETSGYKVLRKNYCGNAHMLILLPDEPDGLAELEKTLTPKKLRQIDDKSKYQFVNIKIPRFAFDHGEELIETLRKLGVESAFDPAKADFTKMTDEKGFFIDVFRQKAMIKVDEEGTVASAITGGVGGMGGGPPKVYTFYADRPFLFLIRENTDNSILFMGRVHHPEKADEGE